MQKEILDVLVTLKSRLKVSHVELEELEDCGYNSVKSTGLARN